MGNSVRFRGHFRHTVDHKGRVAIPYVFRRALESDTPSLVLTKGFDGEIEVHPLSEWEEFEDRTLTALPIHLRPARRFRRRRTANACEATLDGQGRIMLPRNLLEYAQIKGEVVIAGDIGYFEIWNPATFEAFEREAEEHQVADSENLEQMLAKRLPPEGPR